MFRAYKTAKYCKEVDGEGLRDVSGIRKGLVFDRLVSILIRSASDDSTKISHCRKKSSSSILSRCYRRDNIFLAKTLRFKWGEPIAKEPGLIG